MIGVDDQTQTLGSGPSSYKGQILFYDKLLLMHSGTAINEWRYGSYQKAKYHRFADEMEYLLDTPHFLPAGRLAGVPVDGDGVVALQDAIRDVELQLKAALPPDGRITVPVDEFARLQGLRASLMTRLAAAAMTANGEAAISVHEIPRIAQGAPSPSLAAGDVIKLAIERILIPDERTSWEDVFALKADRDLQDRARKLRLWAMKTAKSETSLAVVEEQLADLLADYERYLRAHRLKYTTTSLGAVITAGAEMLEDIVKLRFGKLSGRLFSAARMKADITLSELKAPGRELSLITLVNERLP